jgi:hypothetical protein
MPGLFQVGFVKKRNLLAASLISDIFHSSFVLNVYGPHGDV